MGNRLVPVLMLMAMISPRLALVRTHPVCTRLGPEEVMQVEALRSRASVLQLGYLPSEIRAARHDDERGRYVRGALEEVVGCFEATPLGQRVLHPNEDGQHLDRMLGLEPAARLSDGDRKARYFLYQLLVAGAVHRWDTESVLVPGFVVGALGLYSSVEKCPQSEFVVHPTALMLLLDVVQSAALVAEPPAQLAAVLQAMNRTHVLPAASLFVDDAAEGAIADLAKSEEFRSLPEDARAEVLRRVRGYYADMKRSLGDPPRHRWESLDAAEHWIDDELEQLGPSIRIGHDVLREAEYYETRFDGIRLLLAVRLYAQIHRRPPESLGALVPEFLSKVPIDSASEQPFVYTVLPDTDGWTVQIYAFGSDGSDDGGQGSIAHPKEAFNYPRNAGTDFVLPRMRIHPRVQ